ncbi:MAG: hypothetical protein DHS20C02_08820 [Micavibrio sp.]|nr:MAG: hypothetical protein DHS20C02_08820 [Micavibrio sp.]
MSESEVKKSRLGQFNWSDAPKGGTVVTNDNPWSHLSTKTPSPGVQKAHEMFDRLCVENSRLTHE